MSGTPEDPHAPVSRSPVELARELVRVFEQWETAPGYVVVNVVVARALLAAEGHCEKADAALDRVTRTMGSSRGPDVLEAQVEVFAALSVLRGSE